MKNNYLTLTIIASLFFSNVFAQPICGFDARHQQQMNANPQYRKAVTENEVQIQNIIAAQQSRRATTAPNARTENALAPLYIIPVVVHVIHTGGLVGSAYNPNTAQITGAINYLNQVFAGTYPGMTPAGPDAAGDIQIQFALATLSPSCTPTTGIERVNGSLIPDYLLNGVRSAPANPGADEAQIKNAYRWDPSSYYNIYVVNKIDGNDGTGEFVGGFAELPSNNPYGDGTIILASQLMSGLKTLPHEIGHALNLYHPFEGSTQVTECPPNTDCNTQGDRVCDTDPISFNHVPGPPLLVMVDFTCRNGTNPCTGTPYSIRTENNFMNYTNCYTLFTPGQKARMLAAMTLNNRSSYANSFALNSALPTTFTAPAAPTCIPASNPAGLLSLTAGITSVNINNKQYNSGDTRTDFLSGLSSGFVDRTSNCTNLITAYAGTNVPFTLTLAGYNLEQVRMFIDFNNDGDFFDANEQVYTADNITNPYFNFPHSGSFAIPSSGIPLNTIVRLRIIEEIASAYGSTYAINSPCFLPTYGQAEDYAVFITQSLPVTWEFFKGEKQHDAVHLTWKTSMEDNALSFEVERSSNGTDFTRIGTVPATNNPLGSLYTFDDNHLTGQVMYYRLRQVDRNNQYKYSNLVIIQNGAINQNTVTILNNPFREKFDISISTPQQSKVVVNLMNVNGKLFNTQNLQTGRNSTVVITPESRHLPAGIYFVQVIINGEKLTRKVIRQ